MYKDKKIVVVMPAYNAEKTLRQTFEEVCEQGIVDTVIIVDDCSCDNTVAMARSLADNGNGMMEYGNGGIMGRATVGSNSLPSTTSFAKPTASRIPIFESPVSEPPYSSIPTFQHSISVHVHRHEQNMGYGGNQKSCYKLALEHGADIVIMVHPDCQYTPKLIPAMASMIANGLYPCVLGSRILGGYALKGGMPLWKYIPNRFLTLAMNMLFGAKLSEYHTGYRAFSRELLEKLPLEANTDDFAFDAQMLAEILWTGATIGEVSCPTVYFEDASSINFARSCTYGAGCLKTALLYRLCKLGVMKSKKF
jgi:glycosyltransferase involved in cell wall biosynthesis